MLPHGGLEQRPDRLIVVSDGWDNAPPDLAAEVLRVWRDRLDPQARTSIVHLNPVYDSDTFAELRAHLADQVGRFRNLLWVLAPVGGAW